MTADDAGDGVARQLAGVAQLLERRLAQLQGHDNVFESSLRASLTGGKLVRPRVFLELLDALSGPRAGESRCRDAVRVAAALELWHSALIVHDDILDGDSVRRGLPNAVGIALELYSAAAPRPAAGRLAQAHALITGDLLMAAAMLEIAELDAEGQVRRAVAGVLRECMSRVAEGEMNDVRAGALGSPRAESVRESEAFVAKNLRDKTSSYSFTAPLACAGVLAGVPDALVAQLKAFGEILGEIYQIQDDLLGVFGDSDTTGKSALGDLREGKQTLLIVHACDHPAWQEVSGMFGDPQLDETGAEKLRAALVETGAADQVGRYLDAKMAELARLMAQSELPPKALQMIARTGSALMERSR